jgi:hypothetical protein
MSTITINWHGLECEVSYTQFQDEIVIESIRSGELDLLTGLGELGLADVTRIISEALL